MDLEYWDEVYKHESNKDDRGRKIVHYPSPFAEFCLNKIMDSDSRVLELGTGNGRDAFYFSEQGCRVYAVDQSATAIEHNKNKSKEIFSNGQIEFERADFIDGLQLEVMPDFVYSRFVFHAISAKEQTNTLSWLSAQLKSGVMLLIEARTNHDPLCGQGELVEDSAFICGHYRRFIDSQKFIEEALNFGFRLRYFNEATGLAIYKDEDPVVMRIFLEKI